MLTYSGIHVQKEFGAPSIQDIAVQSMRLPRFCAAGELWYPLGIHLMLVADLLPPELEHHGLLHDAAEICVNDVPRPMKTQEAKELEQLVLLRTYFLHGLRPPTSEELTLIHEADMRAVNVEGTTEIGPRGFFEAQPNLRVDEAAMEILRGYLDRFDPREVVAIPGNIWAQELEQRLRKAIARAHYSPEYVAGYTNAA
jgi:hypothetical protein